MSIRFPRAHGPFRFPRSTGYIILKLKAPHVPGGVLVRLACPSTAWEGKEEGHTAGERKEEQGREYELGPSRFWASSISSSGWLRELPTVILILSLRLMLREARQPRLCHGAGGGESGGHRVSSGSVMPQSRQVGLVLKHRLGCRGQRG